MMEKLVTLKTESPLGVCIHSSLAMRVAPSDFHLQLRVSMHGHNLVNLLNLSLCEPSPVTAWWLGFTNHYI